MKSKLFPKITFRYLSLLIIIFFAYSFAGKLGLSLAYVNASASAIWPPTGIAIAAFLLLGGRVWPAIFLGAFIVNLTTQGNVATSLGIAFGNTLEGFIAMYLIQRFAHGKHAFDYPMDVVKFFGLILLVTMVSPTIGVPTLIMGGFAHLKDFWTIWITWWFGDIGGAITVTPVIILFAVHKITTSLQFNIAKVIKVVIFFLLVIVVSQLIFSSSLQTVYFVFPLLIWGAFSFGRREVTTAVLLIAFISVWNTIHGFGPFIAPNDVNRSLVRIALFLTTTGVTVMTVAAALLERKQTRAALVASEHRFKSLIEKSFEAVVLIDASSRIFYASPSTQQVLGYAPEELQGMVGFDLVLPEDRKMTMQILSKLVLKPGSSLTVQYRSVRKDKKNYLGRGNGDKFTPGPQCWCGCC